MNVRLTALAAALIACSTPVWAATSNVDVYGVMNVGLPAYETYSAAADLFFDPAYTPLLDVTSSPGVTAQISGTSYSASASTTLGSNHAYAQASALPTGAFGATSFSGWYDQVTISGGTGAGTAQFTVQLSGFVDVGAFAGVVGYELVTSSMHPSVLGTDIIVDPGTPTSPWFLISSEVNPVIEYSMVASPYNDPDQFSGLFGAPPDGGIPAIDDPAYVLGGDAGMGFPAPDLVFTPGTGHVNVTLYGTLNFTYGEAFYLVGILNTNLLDLGAFQPFCSFDIECPANPPIDGTGATTLDFSNSANLINIALPGDASVSFASGNAYSVTAVPEPGEWMMMLAGLGLIGWRARCKAV